MKLALYRHADQVARFGLLTDAGLIDADALAPPAHTAQGRMQAVIDQFEELRPALQDRLQAGDLVEAEHRLLPPLPRPGKILCCIANYWEHAQREARPLNMFLKNPDAVIGPGDVIKLPAYEDPWAFMHEAEVALVIKGPAKGVSQDRWRDAVFGVTCLIDATARSDGRKTWRNNSWMGRSTHLRRLGRASRRWTKSAIPTIFTSSSGTMASCGTITAPTIWNTGFRKSSSSPRGS